MVLSNIVASISFFSSTHEVSEILRIWARILKLLYKMLGAHWNTRWILQRKQLTQNYKTHWANKTLREWQDAKQPKPQDDLYGNWSKLMTTAFVGTGQNFVSSQVTRSSGHRDHLTSQYFIHMTIPDSLLLECGSLLSWTAWNTSIKLYMTPICTQFGNLERTFLSSIWFPLKCVSLPFSLVNIKFLSSNNFIHPQA